jgi:hypothetical protein
LKGGVNHDQVAAGFWFSYLPPQKNSLEQRPAFFVGSSFSSENDVAVKNPLRSTYKLKIFYGNKKGGPK